MEQDIIGPQPAPQQPEPQGFTLPKFSPMVTRIIILGCFAIIVFLAMWVAYGVGGVKACSSADGILDNKFVCHANISNRLPPIDSRGMGNLPEFNLTQ